MTFLKPISEVLEMGFAILFSFYRFNLVFGYWLG